MSHKIQGIFRSGRVPEARFTQSGQMVVNVSAATERVWFNGDGEKQTETVWVRFTAWGKRAEFINQWVGKGKRFYVEAHLTPDPETGGPRVYQRNDGSWGAAYEATIDVFELVDWPTDEEKAGMGAAPAQEAPAQQQAAQDPPNAVPSDKIPF